MNPNTNWVYVTGGTLAPDATSYVERQADRDLLASLLAGETCYVLNSRQMGKSSLCVRTIGRLRKVGVRTAFLDLTKFGGRNLTAEQWYAALLSELGRELGLRTEILNYWKENVALPPVQRLFGAISELGLAPDSPFVVFVDEIDVTLSLPFSADEFFAAIRQSYVGRATDEKLKRLSFCLLGTATPADLIQDTRVSPFNVGKRIELSDFTETEAAPLAVGLGDHTLLKRVLHWTGGHPYLTQRLCQAVRYSETRDVDRVCSDLFLTHAAKESDDNLAFVRNRLLKSEADLPALLDVYRKMRSGKPVQDDDTNPLCAILKLSGVAKVEAGKLKVRNRIYEQVFDLTWAELHMPDAEKRRQKEAYRKGVLRTMLVAVGIVACMAFLVLAQVNANSRITAERDKANHLVYEGKMRKIQQEWETDNSGLARRLLEETRNSPHRGFEWGYWQLLNHQKSPILTLQGHTTGLSWVTYSPDGKYLATSGFDNKTKLWSVSTGRFLLELPGRGSSFSPDGTEIVTVGLNDVVAKVWSLESGREISSLRADSGLWVAKFSPDGKLLTTSGLDKVGRIWDARSGRLLMKLKGHAEGLSWAEFSPDGKQIATASGDGTAKLWDTKSGLELRTFKGHTDWVFGSRFSPDGRRILTGSYDRTARVWDVFTGKELLRLGSHQEGVGFVAYSRDGKLIATAENQGVLLKIWDAATGSVVSQIIGHDGDVMACDFSPDGHHITTASLDGTAKVWSTENDSSQTLLREHSDIVQSVSFSSNGQVMATGSKDQTVKLWDTTSRQVIRTLRGHTDQIVSVSFSPDCQKLVSGGYDRTVHVWDCGSGRDLFTLRGFQQTVYAVTFSPDGTRIATASAEKVAKVWDAHGGRLVESISLKNTTVGSVAFSPDGTRLLLGCEDQTVRIWDLRLNKIEMVLRGHSFLQPYGDPIGVGDVAYSPDGKQIASASTDRTVILWDAATGRRLTTFLGHHDVVWRISFSPDGKRLATSSNDRSVRIWDTQTGEELLVLRHPHAVNEAVFSPDGLTIASASWDSIVRLWQSASPIEIERWNRETEAQR